MKESREAIRAYVLSLIEAKTKLPEGAATAGFDYLASGHVDSMGLIRFVLSLESRYDIEIGEADMLRAEFRTLDGVVALIADKLARSGR